MQIKQLKKQVERERVARNHKQRTADIDYQSYRLHPQDISPPYLLIIKIKSVNNCGGLAAQQPGHIVDKSALIS